MGKALSYIGGALLALLSALYLVPMLIDWNGYRGAFEEEASRALGREVRVGGKINLKLLPSPYVRIEQIRIADKAGTLGEPFFRVDSFTMGLAVASLLRGALEATHIELKRPVLALAIDADGRGNWRDVTLSPGALAVLPAEVKLNAVDIVDGTLTVKGGDGELLRLTGLSAEFSADTLKGPFKYRGTMASGTEQRELRFATSEIEANGDLRIKGFVRVPRSGASYTLDGKLADMAGQPRIDGELSVRAPLTAAAAAERLAQTDMLDLRAKLDGTALGIKLSDITVAFDQGGTPQIIVGDGDSEWRDGLRLKVALNSRWLDLDRIAGGSATGNPVEAIRALVPAIVRLLPESGQVDMRLLVDQANLGGDAASNLRVKLERFRGPMLLRELQATLPGGTRLNVSGSLSVSGEPSFSGDISARGTSLARFLGWAAKGQTVVDTRDDGPFSIQGRLGLTGAGVELSALSAELISAPPLTGSVAYRWADRRRLDVRLAGQEFDVSSILPGILDPARVRGLLSGGSASPETPSVKSPLPAWLDSRTTDAAISLNVGKLADGQRVLSQVEGTLALEQGRLQASRVKLTTADGIRIDLEGELSGIEATPRGTIGGDITIATPAALASLLRALDLSPEMADTGKLAQLQRLLPARLAGSLRVGARATASLELDLDGTIKESRTTARIGLETGVDRWREAGADIDIRVDSADAGLALVELLTGQPGLAHTALPQRGGQVRLKAVGRPQTGMVATATLRGERLTASFDGRIAATGSARPAYEGLVRLDAARAEPVLTMLGLSGMSGLADLSLIGAVEISTKPGSVHLKPRGLSIAGEPLIGRLTLTRATGRALELDANLEIARATIPGLLAAVVKRPRTKSGADASQTAGSNPTATNVWPGHPFDLTVLDSVQGRLRLAIGRLALEPGLDIADASIDLELTPNQIRVTSLDGRALNGELKARLMLERAPLAGVALAGAMRIDNAKLESLAGKSAAVGTVGLIMQFSGRALSPQELMAVVQGKGEIALSGAQLNRLSPSVVPQTIASVLDGKSDATGEAIRKSVLGALAAPAVVPLVSAKIPLQIVNGAIQVGTVGFETDDARGSVTTTIELATLKIDSDWRMEAKAAPRMPWSTPSAGTASSDRVAPPAIGIVFVGPLRALASLEPRLTTDALERVLTVWRMERDVAELERLRREDEERHRREQERQRAFEIERARARELGMTLPPLPPAGAPGAPTPMPSTALPQPHGAQRGTPQLAPPSPPASPASGSHGTPAAASPVPAEPSTTGTVATSGIVAPSSTVEVEKRTPPPGRPGPPRPPRPGFNPFPSIPN